MYTVTYFVDDDPVGEAEEYAVGETVTIREKYEKEGYTVSDWMMGVYPAENFDMLASAVAITATTTPNTYTVTYKVDGEQVGEVESYKFGETVKIRDKYVKEGYTVSDWSKTADFTMPAEDVVITATTSQGPKTGDSSNMLLWVVLSLACVAACTGTVTYVKRK